MEIEAENKFLDLIKEAKSVSDLEEIRVSLLGKKGEITNLLRSLGQMEAEERQIKSPQYNKLKQILEVAFKEAGDVTEQEIEARMESEWLDISQDPRD